ncbi:MAG: amidase family protein [Pseudomonadota bacterium]
MSEPEFLPIVVLTRRIDDGALDPVALTRRYLDRAEAVGKPLNAFVALCRDAALAAAADSAARAQARCRRGPLDGIPDRDQGQYRRRRHADQQRFRRGALARAGGRCRGGAPPARRRRGDPRQAQHA